MIMRQLFCVFLLFTFFSSCTIEDEPIDLSLHDDYLMEVTVFFEEGVEDYHIPVTYYETNMYNHLTEKFVSYTGSPNDNKAVFFEVIKEYKKAGLRIEPQENVRAVYINIYEFGLGRDIYYQFLAEGNQPFTFIYDFETDSREVTFE